MSLITDTLPSHGTASHSLSLNEDMYSIKAPAGVQVVFHYHPATRTRVWSYAGMDSTGQTIFSGAGGGFAVKGDPWWKQGLEGLTEAMDEIKNHGSVSLAIKNDKLLNMVEGIISDTANITLVNFCPEVLEEKSLTLTHQYRQDMVRARDEVNRKAFTEVVLTTDGAVNDQAAGVGWLYAGVPDDSSGLRIGTGCEWMRVGLRTNDSMAIELSAILHGLRAVVSDVESVRNGTSSILVRSDSRDCVNLLNKMKSRVKGDDLFVLNHHQELARQIFNVIKKSTGAAKVQFVWVKGHNGDKMNEYCDRLAVIGRKYMEGRISAENRDSNIQLINDEAVRSFSSLDRSQLLG